MEHLSLIEVLRFVCYVCALTAWFEWVETLALKIFALVVYIHVAFMATWIEALCKGFSAVTQTRLHIMHSHILSQKKCADDERDRVLEGTAREAGRMFESNTSSMVLAEAFFFCLCLGIAKVVSTYII